jgi:hypothetical protein
MSLVMGWLSLSRKRARLPAEQSVLRYPQSILILGIVCSVFFLSLALLSFLFPGKEGSLTTTLLFVGFAFLGAVNRRVLSGDSPSGGGGNPILAIDLDPWLSSLVRHTKCAVRSVAEVVSDQRERRSYHPSLGDDDGAPGIRSRGSARGSRGSHRSCREGPSSADGGWLPSFIMGMRFLPSGGRRTKCLSNQVMRRAEPDRALGINPSRELECRDGTEGLEKTE